jgi:hypothetical protein
MTIRTTEKIVKFARPFTLGGFDAVFPAGAYSVETDEELLESLSFPVYRRKLTVIHLPATSDQPGVKQTISIDPNELEAALKRDRMPGVSARREIIPAGATIARVEEADRQALDRAENEGMAAPTG